MKSSLRPVQRVSTTGGYLDRVDRLDGARAAAAREREARRQRDPGADPYTASEVHGATLPSHRQVEIDRGATRRRGQLQQAQPGGQHHPVRVEQLQDSVLAFLVRRRGDLRQLRRRLHRFAAIALRQRAIARCLRVCRADLALDARPQRIPLSDGPRPRRLGPRHLPLPPIEERNGQGRRDDVAGLARRRDAAPLQAGGDRSRRQAQALRGAPLGFPAALAQGERAIVRPLGQRLCPQLVRARNGRTARQSTHRREGLRVPIRRHEGSQPCLGGNAIDLDRLQVGLDVRHLALGAQPVEPRSLSFPLAGAQDVDQAVELGHARLQHRRALLGEQQIREGETEVRFEIQSGSVGAGLRGGDGLRRGLPEQTHTTAERQLLGHQEEIVDAEAGVLPREADGRIGEQAPFPGVGLDLADAEAERLQVGMLGAHPCQRLRLGQRLAGGSRRRHSQESGQ